VTEAANPSLVQQDQRMVEITRVFAAPRELVFEAWSGAEQLKHWYAPHGCTLSHCQTDFRVGGTLHMCISNPTVGDCWTRGVYREIVVPERIEFTLAFSDPRGDLSSRQKRMSVRSRAGRAK
jgi:uncharacterized protein YndB with AHSA1/START domain